MKSAILLLVLCAFATIASMGCSIRRSNTSETSTHPDASPHENMWLKVESTSDGWLANGKSCDNDGLSKELRAWSKYSNSEYNIKGYDENEISHNSVVFQMPADASSGVFFSFLEMLVESRIHKLALYLALADSSLQRHELTLPLDEGGSNPGIGPVTTGVRLSASKATTKFEVNFNRQGWKTAKGCSFKNKPISDATEYDVVVNSMTGGLNAHLNSIKETVEVVLFGIYRETGGESPSWSFLIAGLAAIEKTNSGIPCALSEPYLSLYGFPAGGKGMVHGPRKNHHYGEPYMPDEPPCDDVEYPRDTDDYEPDAMKPPFE